MNLEAVSRRRVVLSAPALVGSVIAAACAGLSAPEKEPVSKEPVALEIQHRWDGAEREPLVVAQARAFEEKYPHVKVNVVATGNANFSTAGYIASMLAKIVAGTPPDVFMVHAVDAIDLVDKSALTYLDPFLLRDKIVLRDLYFPAALASMQIGGKTFALTQTAAGDNPYLFYNKSLLAAAGVDPKQLDTWEGLLAASKTLTRPAGDGFSQIGLAYPGGAFMDWHTVNGGDLLSKDGRKVAFNTDAGRQTLTYMTDSVKALYGSEQRLSEFLSQFPGHPRGGSGGSWVAQKEAMWMTGPWAWLETPKQAPDLQFAGVRLPVNRANSKSKQTTLAESVWTWAMGTGLKKPSEAWLLEKWMSLEEGHKQLMIGMGRATMLKSVVQDKAFFSQNPGWNVVLDTLNAATGLPPSKGWAAAKPLINAIPDAVLSGKYGVADALLQAERAAQAAVDEAYRPK